MFELASKIVSYVFTNEIIITEENSFEQLAKSYIESNLQKPLSVATLCRSLGVSKNALYENFRTVFGKTVNEYITDMRLKKAKKLLCGSSLSIDSICQLYLLQPAVQEKISSFAASLSENAESGERQKSREGRKRACA